MAEGINKNRYVAEKLALAVILVISLAVARLVVELRSAIRMSLPIELARSGLSVKMPQGNGWQCEGKWMYDDTSFAVISVFSVAPGSSEAYARCRYVLAARANQGNLEERLNAEAVAIGGESVNIEPIEKGQIAAGSLAVDWASVNADAGHRGRFEIAFGVCKLAADRQFEIQVYQTTDEPGLAKRVLEKIAKGIRFSDNGPLQAGAEVVSEVRAAGLVRRLSGEPAFFVIFEARGRAIGFSMDATETANTGENASIKSASYFYVRGQIPDERVGSLLSDNGFQRFTWRIEKNSRAGRTGAEMTFQEGVLTVNSSRAGQKANEYVLGEYVVPDMDVVLEPILENVLDGSRREIIIDVIRSDGTIAPVSIEKMAPAAGQTDSNAVSVEMLDGKGRKQVVYYDSSKHRDKIIYEQENSFTFQRADANQVMVLFPERALLVRNSKQLIEREMP